MLLDSYREFRSSDADLTASTIIRNGGGRRVEFKPAGRGFECRANAARLGSLDALYLSCNTPATIEFDPTTYVRQGFQTNGASSISIYGHGVESSVGDVGYIVPDGIEWQAVHHSGYEALVLCVERSLLEQKLSAMTGAECPNLRFEQPVKNGSKRAQIMKATVFHFAYEIDSIGRELSPRAIAELEQAVLGRYLVFNLHNYSEVLSSEPASAGRLKMRLVEEYIYANWSAVLDIDKIAAVAGISSRSLFRSFQVLRGCSPQEFIRRVRLNRAREMLLEGGDNLSVMRIALQCGFRSLGHFARAYRLQFGELPSATARRSGKMI